MSLVRSPISGIVRGAVSGIVLSDSDLVPLSVPDLLAYFDAGLSGITLNSGNVSQENDLSPNGRNAVQGTAANQPNYATGAINGLPSLDFVDSNDLIAIPSAKAPANMWDGGGYIIAVVRPDVVALSAQGNFCDRTAWRVGWISQSSGTRTWQFVYGFSTTSGQWNSAAVTDGSPFVIEWEYNADATANAPACRVNGSSVTMSQVTAPVGTRTSDSGNFDIGNNATPNAFFDGLIPAFLAYDTIPSTANKTKLRQYLGARYGITVS